MSTLNMDNHAWDGVKRVVINRHELACININPGLFIEKMEDGKRVAVVLLQIISSKLLVYTLSSSVLVVWMHSVCYVLERILFIDLPTSIADFLKNHKPLGHKPF